MSGANDEVWFIKRTISCSVSSTAGSGELRATGARGQPADKSEDWWEFGDVMKSDITKFSPLVVKHFS